MNQPIEFKTTIPFITKSTMHSCAAPPCGIIAVLLVCFAFFQNGHAVNPPPDGGYPGGNTAEGQNSLLNLTSGTFNTAVGFLSLGNDAAGQLNTAVGALFANIGDPTFRWRRREHCYWRGGTFNEHYRLCEHGERSV